MIPEPITATISRPVPSASATRRRDEVDRECRRCRSRAAASSSVMPPPARSRMRWRSSATVASNAFAGPTGTGSGIDQCSQSGSGSSSSWARSHTVIVNAGRCRTSSSEVGVASPRSRPARRAAATAPGWTRRPGGCRLSRPACPSLRSTAPAASCERAELCVHTNSDRPAERLEPRESDDRPVSADGRGARSGGARPRWTGCRVDQAGRSEHVEVVGQQVRLDPGEPAQLDGRTVARTILVGAASPLGAWAGFVTCDRCSQARRTRRARSSDATRSSPSWPRTSRIWTGRAAIGFADRRARYRQDTARRRDRPAWPRARGAPGLGDGLAGGWRAAVVAVGAGAPSARRVRRDSGPLRCGVARGLPAAHFAQSEAVANVMGDLARSHNWRLVRTRLVTIQDRGHLAHEAHTAEHESASRRRRWYSWPGFLPLSGNVA